MAEAGTVPLHPIKDPHSTSQEERLQRGREQRTHLSRTELGEIGKRQRQFDAVDVLLSNVEGRITSLLALKYQRMSVSAFAFFRGAVSIMAADLANSPSSGLNVQLCGDAHVQNLGSFETPDGRLVFDINDFDETIAGPWEWDVKRMAASIVLAGSEAGHKKSSCSTGVQVFAAAYCRTIEQLADLPILVAARHQIHRLSKVQVISAALQQAAKALPSDLLKRYTETTARGHVNFRRLEGVLWRLRGEQRQQVADSLPLYRDSLLPERVHLFDLFRPLDFAFKVVGTGSVGLRDYVVLMVGNGAQDALFLQIKQEVQSAYARHLRHRIEAHQGQRVAEGQRKIQPLSDLLLGWTRIAERDFLVRQLNDHKGKVDVNQLRGAGLNSLAGIAGELLARGHARSGDALAIKGYIGSGEKVHDAIVRFGLNYAARAESDFELFQKAIKTGRVKVTRSSPSRRSAVTAARGLATSAPST